MLIFDKIILGEFMNERIFQMKSKLIAIINRLTAMVEASEEGVQTRRFEHEGDLKAEVNFNPEEQLFTLTEVQTGFVSQFDDIDIVAMEIYDLIF